MAKQYLEEHPEEESVLRSEEELTAKRVMDAAKEGDKVADTCVEVAAEPWVCAV